MLAFRFKNIFPSFHKKLSHLTLYNYRVLFFGSDIISKEVLIPLHQNFSLPLSDPSKLLTDLQVITHHKSAARGQYPIHDYCTQNNLLYHEPLTAKSKDLFGSQWDEFVNKTIKGKQFDFGIACSFGYMIPNNMIDCCSQGIIIIHPSLLPKYRGAAPIYHALLQGDNISGVSFIDISKNRFDAGPILLQTSLQIPEKWNYKDLALGLGKLAGIEVLRVVKDIKELRTKAIVQDENKRTSAKKIKPEETFAIWDTDNPYILKRKQRSFMGSNMHALKTYFQNKLIFIEELDLLKDEEIKLLEIFKKLTYGGIYLINNKKYKNNVYVRCKDGWVSIKKWRFYNQTTRESYKFLDLLDKEKLFKAVDSLTPYSFTIKETN